MEEASAVSDTTEASTGGEVTQATVLVQLEAICREKMMCV